MYGIRKTIYETPGVLQPYSHPGDYLYNLTSGHQKLSNLNKRVLIILLSICILLILYFIFTGSKKGNNISIVGNYKSVSPTLFEKSKFALVNIECFYAGRELKIMADSTFALMDSTTIQTGKWRQEDDLLSLHFLGNKYKMDSLLHIYGSPKVPSADYSLKLNNTDLYYYLDNSNVKCVEIFKIKN